MKFKVGDKVRLTESQRKYIENFADFGTVPSGLVGKIIEVREDAYNVVLDDKRFGNPNYGDGSWFVYEDDVEALPAHKFNVGDKVKFVRTSDFFAERHIGKTGEIIAIKPCGVHDYKVRFDDGGKDCAMEDELELYVEPAKPTLRFKVGDRVVVKPGRGDGAIPEGTVAVVVEAKPERRGAYDYKVKTDDDDSVFNDADLDPAPTPVPGDFRVGDKVRVTKNSYVNGHRVGEIGEVTSVGEYTDVRFSDGMELPWRSTYLDDLELVASNTPTVASEASKGIEKYVAPAPAVEEKRTPKVGDYVRIVRLLVGGTPDMIGGEGKVTQMSDIRKDAFIVALVFGDKKEPRERWFVPGEVEIIDAPTPAKRPFAIGDKVRVVKNSYSPGHRVGETGVVASIDDKLIRVDFADYDGLPWEHKFSDNLELIAEAPPAPWTPKIGDKVRVVKSRRYNDSYADGAEGVIIKERNGEFFLELTLGGVKWNDRSAVIGNRPLCGYAADELSLISPAPATPKPRPTIANISNLRFIRRGDQVEVQANGAKVATVTLDELKRAVEELTKEAM